MKNTIFILLISTAFLLLTNCGISKKRSVDNLDAIENITAAEEALFKKTEGDTIHIASDETEYEIIIIEPGFNSWLLSIAKPEGYYTQSFLENRNALMVINWNQRVQQPQQFNPNLYEIRIDYQQGIDYGYEVNYKLYNYFIYFQRKYRQRLGPFTPRI